MALRRAVVCAVVGFGAARVVEWKPAVEGVQTLDAIEKALAQVSGKGLDARQKKAAAHVVSDVEKVVANLKTSKNMTKDAKQAQVKVAIQELQSLQAMWQLAQVENNLQGVLKAMRLNATEQAEAKKVVASVDAVAEGIEAGELTGAKQHEQVGKAIQDLGGLEKLLSQTKVTRKQSKAEKLKTLEHELAEKQADLKVLNLRKQILEKKEQLQKLETKREAMVEHKHAMEVRAKEQVKDASEQAAVAKLLKAAKALAQAAGPSHAKASPANASLANATPAAKVNASALAVNVTKASKVTAKPHVPSEIQAIVVDLSSRAAKVRASLKAMVEQDASEQNRLRGTERLSKTLRAAGRDPSQAQNDLRALSAREHREFLKARAAKVVELKELDDGIAKVKAGDVRGLASLLDRMEHESKKLEAKSNSFLH